MLIDELKFDQKGLIPVVVQDHISGEVLMQAYMNRESLQKTLETGRSWFYSRSRGALWEKGATSGNIQKVKGIYVDCDGDCLLIKADQTGGACHTGNRSCFATSLWTLEDNSREADIGETLEKLYKIVEDRKENPVPGSYTCYLFDKGIDKMLKKVGEESTEVVIAAKNDDKKELVYEISDLLYHMTVLMSCKNITFGDIAAQLMDRFK